MNRNYQYNYSGKHVSMFDQQIRVKKAQKTLSVLNDYLKETLDLTLLDIGSSSGIMTMEYAKQFKKVIGIDIDKRAIEFAKKNNKTNNIEYLESPIEDSGLKDETIDVVTCSHIYEHVPSDLVLVDEIYRLLKPGGICYLAAGNKYNIVEAHYKLPFLSYFPKKVADAYIRLFTDEKEYYEKHRSLSGLKKLVSRFNIHDYTLKIIKYPSKFSAEEMLKERTFKYYFYNFIALFGYFLIPTYIWILEKPVKNKKWD
jgi:2-polyprenyl-3-methyl-5-hydroxy-6-metoxy-1,4-benzoquinol methylase